MTEGVRRPFSYLSTFAGTNFSFRSDQTYAEVNESKNEGVTKYFGDLQV